VTTFVATGVSTTGVVVVADKLRGLPEAGFWKPPAIDSPQDLPLSYAGDMEVAPGFPGAEMVGLSSIGGGPVERRGGEERGELGNEHSTHFGHFP
jgi:hypothetical protein